MGPPGAGELTRLALPLAARASTDVPTTGPLVDRFGRVHDDLRVSVTDRCNLRCTYCMPEEVEFRPQSELLTFEEITRFVTVAAGLGVTKVRLTGGEPLLRRDLPELVRQVAAVPGVRDVGLTTNGLLLDRLAHPLRAAGLKRVNVSLDTLDPGRFRELARRDGLPRVLAGLTAAKRTGFDPVKVNAVALRGFIEHDLAPLARFCREHGFEFRLIESMPIGGGAYDPAAVVSAAELLDRLRAEFGPLMPAAGQDPHAPASAYDYADGGGRVGVIASVTAPFCGTCDRVRLTADGQLRSCLFARDEHDVKHALRFGTDADVERGLRECVWGKAAGHGTDAAGFARPGRTMHAIGG